MRDEAVKDACKVWVYAAASVLLGAWLAPGLYNAGKALAEVSATKQTNGALDALAAVCRAADFPAFFQGSLLLAALVLFFPLTEWLKVGRGHERGGERPWSLRLPAGAMASSTGQRLRKNEHAGLHLATGFLLTAGMFLMLGYALLRTGGFQWRPQAGDMAGLYARLLPGAAALALIQELLFRGMVLGLFLRAMSPPAAVCFCALLFTGVHSLVPPPGLTVADPDAGGIGFELLRGVTGQWADWRLVLTKLAPIFAMGLVLGFARWRTASLWLPIGLHAGWLMAVNLFDQLAVESPGLADLLAGASLQEGLIPLLGVLMIGVMVHFFAAADEEASGIPA